MNYLPQLRDSLIRAAYSACDAPPAASGSKRPRRWRAILASGLVLLAASAVALAATGVFQRGTSLGPELPTSPGVAQGVAIPASVHVLRLRVSDPGGGPPWGLRVARTTRGLTCVDAGRLDYGTVGVLGIDGAFHDDRRFHPLSRNVFEGQGCDTTDARGNGFVNVALQNATASGFGDLPVGGGCRPAEELSRAPRAPACPQADMREIYFGLLGPDARSLTYRTAGGSLRTISTAPPEGAYLIVLPQKTTGCLAPARGGQPRPGECMYRFRGNRGGPEVPAGVISQITYTGGRVCHVAAPGTRASLFGSCPPVGFIAPARALPTPAQLTTPVSVHELPARRYCTSTTTFLPCEGRIPAGYRAIRGGEPSLLVQVSFRARVAIPNSSSYYETALTYPRDGRGCTGSGGPTDSDIRAGERITQRMFVPYSCPGVFHGSITYVATTGAASSMPVPGLEGQNGSIPVARFSFLVPSRHPPLRG
jgi:hypothetical protein